MTHHSEYLPLETVFLSSAKDAFQSQEHLSKQWKSLHYISEPNYENALQEYNKFENLVQQEGATIHYFSKEKHLSIDAIYCRDAAIATDFGMILCAMGKEGRRNEPAAQRSIFEKQNISILGEIVAPGTLEGGDVAWLDTTTMAVGHTYRTNLEGIKQLKQLLEPKGIQILVAEMPHYKGADDVFHLMSVLSPVAKDIAVVYSPLMPIAFRNELLLRGFRLVEVPEAEFESMGCNVLAIAPKKCIMVAGNPITKQRLEAAGCEVFTYKGNEISVKGGGGPTCLTRPLLRKY